MEDITLHIFNELHDIEETEGSINVAGYACVYGKPNANHQIVNSGSFRKFWDEYYKGTELMPSFTYEHNRERVIGKWDSIDFDDKKGVYVVGHIDRGIEFNDKYLIPNIQKGNIKYLSTEGFVSRNDIEFVSDEDFYVHNFRLTAISLVSVPACTESEIAFLNSLREAPEVDVKKAVEEAESMKRWYLLY